MAGAVVDVIDLCDACDSPKSSADDAAGGTEREAVLARVLARYGEALFPAERSFVARQSSEVLLLLANGLVSPAELLQAAAVDVASPARPAARAEAAADEGFAITAVLEPAEPAWLSRAKAALQSLLSDATLAPRKTREAALEALSAVVQSALTRGEAAAGRAVFLDKLLARIVKGPAGVKSEQTGDSPAKVSRLSAAQSSPHTSSAAGDDAAAARCVEVVCRVLTSAGWYHDAVGEENEEGASRQRVMLLGGARELPALLARLHDVTSALDALRAEVNQQEAAKRAAEPLMAALDALVIESDDDEEAAAAAWEERSAADAAKVVATPAGGAGPDLADADPAAAPGFEDNNGFEDYLWERYAFGGAGGSPPPSESPPSPLLQRHDAAIVVSDGDDDAAVTAPPHRRAAAAPPKPKVECRIIVFLPGDRGRVRMLLPPTASLLDVYAAASDFLAKPARNDGIATAPPILPAHNWAIAPAVDTHAHRLVRPDPPPGRSFLPHELATISLAQAGLFPSGRLVLERNGATLRAPPRLVAGRIDVLRLTTPLPNGNILVSPIVHLHDVFSDRGLGIFKKMEGLLQLGWSQHSHSRIMTLEQLSPKRAGLPTGYPIQVILNNAYWRGGALGARASIPAQDYAEDVLKCASDAVRAQIGGGGIRAANAAADDLLRKRHLMQASGLLYLSDGTLHDHVDHIGHYLVLMAMGCAVDFRVGADVVRFESGDALVFNGGTAHGVMHGVRQVHLGTCPPSLPKLKTARLSLQLRQQ